MRTIALAGLITITLALGACSEGSSGALVGRVVDGFGNPLGGPAVRITLSDNPVVNTPDQWGNFTIHAPVGDYTMLIVFSNPAGGFNYRLEEHVRISRGSKSIGTFTLFNVWNVQAWDAYRNHDWNIAIALFRYQAESARSGQVAWLRSPEGDENENTLLTQGVLAGENGLGWCHARGLGDAGEGRMHFEAALSNGYNNYDAKVGLAGIALGKGDGLGALELLQEVIDEPGYYDSSQIHDDISEVDLIAARAFAEFLLGYDTISEKTAMQIADEVESEGNTGSKDLLEVLELFR